MSYNFDVKSATESCIEWIREWFEVNGNGCNAVLGLSGGKDSLCMAQLVYNLVQRGKINPSQLVVQFIDEEAIFPCIEKTVKNCWNKNILHALNNGSALNKLLAITPLYPYPMVPTAP